MNVCFSFKNNVMSQSWQEPTEKKRMGLSFITYYQNYIPLAPCWLPQSDDCMYTHTCINLWQPIYMLYIIYNMFSVCEGKGEDRNQGLFSDPETLWHLDLQTFLEFGFAQPLLTLAECLSEFVHRLSWNKILLCFTFSDHFCLFSLTWHV
jgi:hypothetical protein